jgi:PKD repeat protein
MRRSRLVHLPLALALLGVGVGVNVGAGVAAAAPGRAPGAAGPTALALNANPPASPVRLVFIHHSTGGNWLADPEDNGNGGDLGRALMNNNYYVSATNYGWGPSSIGDMTDIGHWWIWFRGDDSAADMTALYAESGQNLGDFGPWPRLASAPSGENRIVMFKSCFPNSNIGGSPSDPPTTGENPMRGEWAGSETYTVGNAKGIYNDILAYFATRQDKLFVVITAPPLQESETTASQAANARALNNWLVGEWLEGYQYHNVAVFDFYTVLTSNAGDPGSSDLGSVSGNHHRYRNGEIEHTSTQGSNFSAYPSGDSHPTAAGGAKATGEYLPLLNIYYHCWAGDGGCPGQAATCTLACDASAPASAAVGTAVSFTGSATPSDCSGTVTYDWSFGDGSAHSAAQSPTHTYTAAGTYTWQVTSSIQGVTCQRSGSITITGTCTLSCQATPSPTSGAAPLTVSFTGSSSPSNCSGTQAYDWNFGDGSTHASTQNATHTYAAPGTYTWAMTTAIQGVICQKTGTITVSAGCSVSCQASATPVSGTAPLSVAFAGSATPSGCSGATTYDWSFGDGSAHQATQSPTHTYAAAGTYTWTFTASAGGHACTRTGQVTVSAPPTDAYGYVVPSVAHSTGTAGTNWRSDVAIVASGSAQATLHLTYHDAATGAATPATRTMTPGSTVEYRDILVSVFGFAAGSSVNGTVDITSNQPLVITSRTYNQETATRTYGQYYPALVVAYPGGRGADSISGGDVGILAGLKKNTAYRTNVGMVNLSGAACTVNFTLVNASGAAIGTVQPLTADGHRWKQLNDIFQKAGVASQDVAYARVEVQTSGCSAWAYASVIDQATGDPTTIPVLLP